MLAAQDFDVQVLGETDLPVTPTISRLSKYSRRARPLAKTRRISRIVGKYVSLPDAYLSIIEALHHAGIAQGTDVDVHLIDGEELTSKMPGMSCSVRCAASGARRFWAARLEGKTKQHAGHANTTFRSSESALACKQLSANSLVMWLA